MPDIPERCWLARRSDGDTSAPAKRTPVAAERTAEFLWPPHLAKPVAYPQPKKPVLSSGLTAACRQRKSLATERAERPRRALGWTPGPEPPGAAAPGSLMPAGWSRLAAAACRVAERNGNRFPAQPAASPR